MTTSNRFREGKGGSFLSRRSPCLDKANVSESHPAASPAPALRQSTVLLGRDPPLSRRDAMSLATPPLPTTIESLPDEVLCRIMELARLDWPAGRASLFAASLVCRLWRDAAQRALFTHELRGRSSLLLSSQALGRYNPVSLTIKDGPGHAFGVEVKAVLERCRGIRSLSLEKAEVVGLEWSVLLLPALAGASCFFSVTRLPDPFADAQARSLLPEPLLSRSPARPIHTPLANSSPVPTLPPLPLA